MKRVFLLQHAYELNGIDEEKIIGIYSTEQKAKAVIEEHKKLTGFKDYPKGFCIDEYELDKNFWEEGFIHCDDA
ncbi:hypothetical protein IAI10_06100 [Clostridium sp. 19966]|uniref:DUF7336 domain-containing protein n=1 Tax=Clostridium sp. 19966 TaxID=2768166 RepID=UPI0028DEF8B7|nr:hypothetical protein [Clostridium sp. 19966]MDT8716222.1 hypothetical protein [Clostridium sp. 19966]